SIVIMTSNIGAAEIARNTPLGFAVSDDETGITYDDMKARIMGELKKVFRPEFLNRIDEVIVFHKLTRDEIKEIVDLLLRRIRESMAERELSLNLSDDAKDLLVEKGWDPAMGARPLRRAIQRYIEDPLADKVLSSSMEPGSTVEVGKAGDGEDPEVKIEIIAPRRASARRLAWAPRAARATGTAATSPRATRHRTSRRIPRSCPRSRTHRQRPTSRPP